jgi:signal transduction histidine kinase
MGGTVKVDSIEGVGTTFMINLSMQSKIIKGLE